MSCLPPDPFCGFDADTVPPALRAFIRETFTGFLGPNTHALVLGGGAMYGMMYIGALMALCRYDQQQYAQWVKLHLRRVVGSSAGALVGFLIVAGVSPWHMPTVIVEARLGRLLAGLLDISAADMRRRCALTSGKALDVVLQEIVARITGSMDTTFAQLHAATGRQFCVCVTNGTSNRAEFWSHENRGDMPVWLALRCTAAVPGVFPSPEGMRAMYYDGGIICNVPCHLAPPQHTLTLLVHGHVSHVGNGDDDDDNRPAPILEFFGHLLSMYSNAAQLGPMRTVPAYVVHTVPCVATTDTGLFGPYAFHAPAGIVHRLIADGAASAFRAVMCHVAVAAILMLHVAAASETCDQNG